MVTTKFLTTLGAANRLGIHPQTLRHWERIGVIPPAMRRRGLRVYTPADVERIKGIVFETAAVTRKEPE